MIFSRALFLLAALPFVVVAASSKAIAEDPKAQPAEGPLLIAQLPAKVESAKYDLKYKLSRGDVLRYDVAHRASIKSTIDQTTQSAQTKTDSVKAWKVTDVLPEGDIEFMNVVEKVHMVNQLPERTATEYDSTRDKTPPPGFEDAAKAVGVPLSSIRMTPHGKIVRRESKIRAASADDDGPIVLRLPDEPVAIGDTWDESFDVQIKLQKGGTKSIQTRRHHKLAAVKDGIATIEVTYQVLSPIDAAIEVQIVQKLMTGQVQFDIEKGRIVSQQMDVDKRVLGFAGPTSSMQYIMTMEEKLLKDAPKTAAKPKNSAKSKTKPLGTKSSATKTVNNRKQPSRPTQTASRPKTQQPANKTIRR